MAKRKTTTKKTAKKPAAKKAPKRAAPAKKKAASKKAPSKKKTTAKKTSSKKAPKKPATKKAGSKKTASKKTASRKAPTRKKAATKKTASKKAPSKKTTAKKSTSRKPSTKKKPAGASTTKKKKSTSSKPDDAKLKAARDAASRLAALAGLPSVQSNTLEEPVAEKKQRRLTKSPLSPAVLDQFRDLLLQKRRAVAGDVSAIEGEALNPSRSGSLSSLPQHMADQGSDEFEQTLSLGIAASQRRLLIEIEAALDRIDDGVFGICEMTGRAIQKARLEATPWCRYSLEGARMADRGMTS